MAHQIAISSGNVAYLDQNGQPWIISQNSSGVWQPKASLALPLPSGVTGFASIAAVDAGSGPLFIALASPSGPSSDGVLYYTDLSIPWSPISPAPYPVWSDFSVTTSGGQVLIAGFVGQPLNGQFSLTTLSGIPGLTAPSMVQGIAVLDANQPPLSDQGPPPANSVAVTFRDGLGVVLFTYGAKLYSWINIAGDGFSWMPAPITLTPSNAGGGQGTIPINCLYTGWGIAPPNTPNNPLTLWAIMLVDAAGSNAVPFALYNSSHFDQTELIQTNQGVSDTVFGSAWQNYGLLPKSFPGVPLLSTIAVSNGFPDTPNGAAVYTIGIGTNQGGVQDQYAYALSQAATGDWFAYNNQTLPGLMASRLPWSTTTSVQVTDLAMVPGLVAYIGTDGNIYASTQASDGSWLWYGQIPPPPAKSGGCVIATAAMGSPLDPRVEVLRRFRDEHLLRSRLAGMWTRLLNLYYRLGTPVAGAMRRNQSLRALLRWILVYPAVMLAERWVGRRK